MQNELYLTMLYRPVVSGKRFVEKSADTGLLQSQQDQAVAKLQELASNLEAVLKEYAPTRLGMYEAPNGVIFSAVLEHFGYILNRVVERVPVLKAPIGRYLLVSRLLFSENTGTLYINTPPVEKHIVSNQTPQK